MHQYIEFSFHLPFFDLTHVSWASIDSSKERGDNHEIMAIAQWLDVALDTDVLLQRYGKQALDTGDVYVYYNANNPQIFLYFDLHKDPTDQCSMIQFGLRCPFEQREMAMKLIEPLFYKSGPRSPLMMDTYNDILLRNVETPDFYLKNRVLHRFCL
jgi:hypothetical protein